jgi:epoxyqueuosine reductase
MAYLSRRFDERVDPRAYLPGARSVICVAMNYYRGDPGPAKGARIARYAWGEDYHDVVKERLHALADWLRQQMPGIETRACVDTAPVMEKELAARAGVGWLGKNTCVINPGIGSWLVLGEIITTLDLPPDEPAVDRCGSCRRCVDACPTGAIVAPYQLDASRCISYLTIERREPIPREFHDKLQGWLVGCDICQEVCPWNSKAPASTQPAFAPRLADGKIMLSDVLSWTQDDHHRHLRGSAIKRVKLTVLQANARILAETREG